MPESTETSTGLDPKVSGLLTYVLGFITGVVFLVIEKKHPVVRFHAAQSIVVWVGYTILMVVVTTLFFPLFVVLGGGFLSGFLMLLTWLLQLAGLALWIFLMWKGWQLEKFKIPVAGDLAERIVGQVPPAPPAE